MSNVLPEGEDLRRAIKWVSDNVQDNPDKPLGQLVQEAIFRFNISPRDSEFLISFFRERRDEVG